MANLRKRKRFFDAIDRGLSRRRALELAGFRCTTPGSAASVAHDLIKNRYGKTPKGFDRLRPCLQEVWRGLSEETKEALQDLPKGETLAENLQTYLRAYAPPAPPPPPQPQPVRPPLTPEPAISLTPIPTEDLLAAWRAQNWQSYIVYGGRNADEPPTHREGDGIWTPEAGFRSHDQIALDEAAAEEAARPVFRQTDDLRLLTRRRLR